MNRQFTWIARLASFLFTISLLSACGGGGGGGGDSTGGGSNTSGYSFTVSMVSGTTTTTTTYNQTASTTAPAGYDPYMYGYIFSSATFVELYDNYSASLGWDSHFIISIPTLTTGTFNAYSTSFYYVKRGVSGAYWSTGTNGTVTFSKIDSAGGRIQGSFNNISLYNLSADSSMTVSGTFNVLRAN